ncbi:MAG: UDP-2,4-diacetamido-2,4,6-trideoxy-beta-L-altropyranose hydrolase [Sulfuricella sp.]|nr:UDP-2,4-diacetamido-2,4,6-trideoxy-beta-L-altropyranose hydrolase [Sulfuricella sp.]
MVFAGKKTAVNIVVRADSSVTIGTGHVMRCLVLADALRAKGAKTAFVCRELAGNVNSYVERKGYPVYPLLVGEDADWQVDAEQTRAVLLRSGEEIDWLVVDHYGLDARWETRLRTDCTKIMVVDDLADRPHDCDLLLDQNYLENAPERYKGLIPDDCITFLGPRYALLRNEFREARKALRKRDGTVRRILVFFGGSDPTNETVKVLEAIRRMGLSDMAVDVVVGSTNPHRDMVRQRCDAMPDAKYWCQVENMAELMSSADLAIGAGGSATWERCYLGLPTMTMVAAPNQLATTVALSNAGVIWNLGWHHEIDVDNLVSAIGKARLDPESLRDMGQRALKIVGDGMMDVVEALLRIPGAAMQRDEGLCEGCR